MKIQEALTKISSGGLSAQEKEECYQVIILYVAGIFWKRVYNPEKMLIEELTQDFVAYKMLNNEEAFRHIGILGKAVTNYLIDRGKKDKNQPSRNQYYEDDGPDSLFALISEESLIELPTTPENLIWAEEFANGVEKLSADCQKLIFFYFVREKTEKQIENMMPHLTKGVSYQKRLCLEKLAAIIRSLGIKPVYSESIDKVLEVILEKKFGKADRDTSLKE